VSGAAEALFLRQFSADIRLLTQCSAQLSAGHRRDLARAGVRTITTPVAGYELAQGEIHVYLEGETGPLVFDVIYPALGTRPRNELATLLGIPSAADGKVVANAPFGTRVAGVYCAGDLVEGLDQIVVALGQGAVAATRAHNWLREQEALTTEAVFHTHVEE
jgi:thioredoxin reductase (NADPH)